MRKISRLIKMAVNRFRVLKYRLSVSVLEFLSSKELLVKKHYVKSSKFYPLQGPTDYGVFSLFRCEVKIQYVVHRFINTCEKWYYPSWKKDDPKNAILVICNTVTEEFEIQMRSFLKGFIFHPDKFEKSIYICSGRPYRYVSVNESKFYPYRENVDISKPDVQVCMVDLSQASFKSVGKFSADCYKGNSMGPALKNMSEDMLRKIERSVESINKIVSGVEESYDMGVFELVPDVLCSSCGLPVIRKKSTGDMYCMNHEGFCNSDIYRDGMKFLYKPVGHVEWMRVCENTRESLKELYDRYN